MEINISKQKIRSFTDLKVWQEGHKLVLLVYECTKEFPREEIFGLTSQLRRAAVSVTSNITEGFGRRTKAEKTQFYYLANGSLLEVKNQLIIAKDLKYISEKRCNEVLNNASYTHAILQALIKSSFTK
jgi:four helix bundle protein